MALNVPSYLMRGMVAPRVDARVVTHAPDVSQAPVRIAFACTLSWCDVLLALFLAWGFFHPTSATTWLLAILALAGRIWVRRHRAHVVIDDNTVTVTVLRPFRPPAIIHEAKADYPSIGYARRHDRGRLSGLAGLWLKPRHTLFLRHGQDRHRDILLYSSERSTDMEPWMAALSRACAIAAEDITPLPGPDPRPAPLQRPEGDRIDFAQVPDDLKVRVSSRKIVISLPHQDSRRIGPRIALAIFIVPLVIWLGIVSLSSLIMITALCAASVWLSLAINELPPPPAHRITLIRAKGLWLHYRRLLWPCWDWIAWDELQSVHSAEASLCLRDGFKDHFAGTQLSEATRHWLIGYISAASRT